MAEPVPASPSEPPSEPPSEQDASALDASEDAPELPGMPLAGEPTVPPPTLPSAQRIHRPVREQVEWVARSLDELLPLEHPARAIWALLERLDLSAFSAQIQAVMAGPGRPASDPRVLLALWILATVDGISSARRLAELTERHLAYQWLRGGVPLNYHLLADFRVAHQQALDDLLTQTIAALLHADVLTLRRVAQDGLRVRASAGASSFRRKASLERCVDEARAQVDQLSRAHQRADQRADQQADPTVSRRAAAARQRAADERLARAEAALRQVPAIEASKARQRKKLMKGKRERVQEARVSTTDPDARVMKMGNGGFNPAANVQIATDRDSRAVLAVAVSNQGSDGGLAAPLAAQVARRTGQHPRDYLLDGGLATRDDITHLAAQGVTVYAPPEPPRTTTSGRSATDPRPDDSPAVAAWRQRMGSDEAKQIYKERGSTAEWTNAQWRMRHHLVQFSVRGLTKMTTVALLYAVTHNLLRWWVTLS